MLIAVGLAGVFGSDNVADFFFHGLARDILPIASLETALKKELKLEQPLGRMDVFVGRGATDGGLVHMNIFGDIAQHHRFQMTHAVIEKLLLKFKNALSHAVERLLALLDTLDQPGGG